MSIDDLRFGKVIPVSKLRGIYLLWKDGRVVYVGQSESILQRVGLHLANPSKDFDGVSYAIVETGDLNDLEAELIIKFQPQLNKGMPMNRKYASLVYIKKHLKINGWRLRKITSQISPVWKTYYRISDVMEFEK